MSKTLAVVLMMLVSVACRATEDTAVQLEQLDRKVQSLKSQMLELTTDIARVEQQIYPENTRVNVFLSVQQGVPVTLESVSAHIDGALVGSHIYTDAENRAIATGGIQKLYSGFIITGEHEVVLKVIGRRADGSVVELSQDHRFDKQDDAGMIDARLVSGAENKPGLEMTSR